MSKKKCIQTTNDSALFVCSAENREPDITKRKKLIESMKLYGFLPCFPLACFRNEKGQLVIKDGQHRYEVAVKLGLPIHYVEEETDFDVALVNCTAKGWTLRDYAEKWAREGRQDYTTGLEFAQRHDLCVGVSFALLAGTSGLSGVTHQQFNCGEFKVKEMKWAESVAALYCPLRELEPKRLHKTPFIDACVAVCRVKGFDPKRLLSRAPQQRDKLRVDHATRDGYLEMLEAIYNFRVRAGDMFSLKMEAQKIMAARSAAVKKASRKRAATVEPEAVTV